MARNPTIRFSVFMFTSKGLDSIITAQDAALNLFQFGRQCGFMHSCLA